MPDEGTPAETATTEVTEGTTAPEGTTQTGQSDPAASLDDHAQKVIEAIRGDFKTERTKRQAAEERATAIESAIKTALGIEQAPPDPAALAQQLTEQQAAARQAQVELAVYRAAATAGGNPSALLDSRSFVSALSGVDPTDTSAVSAAITAAIAANPLLAAAAPRRAPGPNPAAGSSASGAPDLESQIADAQKRGDMKAVLRLQNQKLYSASGAS